jgi:hypothetical protein
LIEDSSDASIELDATYFGEFGSDISDLGVVHPASSVSEFLKFGTIVNADRKSQHLLTLSR